MVLSLRRAKHLASVCFEFSIDELWKFRFFKLNQAQLFRNDGCKLTAFDKTKTWINGAGAPVASIPFSQANCIQHQVATLIHACLVLQAELWCFMNSHNFAAVILRPNLLKIRSSIVDYIYGYLMRNLLPAHCD